jgi:hypothetical protein
MVTNILLAAILVTSIVHCIVLIMYLRRKKPGPKPRKGRTVTAPDIDPHFAKPIPAPKKRFRARTYEERQMKA